MKKRNRQKKQRAFTLIELTVVLAIFALISATVLANYRGFGRKTLLKNLAYQVALSLREAQVSGITGRNVDLSGGSYYSSYGVYFSAIDKNQYIFFKDRETIGAPHKYDGSIELVKSYSISPKFHISNLCTRNSAASSCLPANELHISFKRPEPDAYIYTESGGPYAEGIIELQSQDGDKIYIDIYSTGQIAVRKNI